MDIAFQTAMGLPESLGEGAFTLGAASSYYTPTRFMLVLPSRPSRIGFRMTDPPALSCIDLAGMFDDINRDLLS